MVNVTHNAHDRCSALQHFFGILGAVEQLFFNGHNHLTGVLCAHFLTNHGSGVKIYKLVNGCHNAQSHQLLDDLTGSCLESACQLANRNFLGNFHANDLLDHGLLLLAALLVLAHGLADLLLLAAATAVTQIAIGLGDKGIQLFVVLGKVDLGGSGIYDAYCALLVLTVTALGGLAAHDCLHLELLLGSGGNVIVLIHAAASLIEVVAGSLVALACVILVKAILTLTECGALTVAVEAILALCGCRTLCAITVEAILALCGCGTLTVAVETILTLGCGTLCTVAVEAILSLRCRTLVLRTVCRTLVACCLCALICCRSCRSLDCSGSFDCCCACCCLFCGYLICRCLLRSLFSGCLICRYLFRCCLFCGCLICGCLFCGCLFRCSLFCGCLLRCKCFRSLLRFLRFCCLLCGNVLCCLYLCRFLFGKTGGNISDPV